MKKLMLKVVFLIVPLISFWGCQNTIDELSESEKDTIVKEVSQVFEEGMIAANRHDEEAMMQVHWNSKEYIAAIDGYLIKGWEGTNEAVTYIHSNPKYQSFTVNHEELIVKVLSVDAAIVTASGNLNNVPTSEGLKSTKFVVTMLMEKIDGKWLKTVVHESTQEDLFKQ